MNAGFPGWINQELDLSFAGIIGDPGQEKCFTFQGEALRQGRDRVVHESRIVGRLPANLKVGEAAARITCGGQARHRRKEGQNDNDLIRRHIEGCTFKGSWAVV